MILLFRIEAFRHITFKMCEFIYTAFPLIDVYKNVITRDATLAQFAAFKTIHLLIFYRKPTKLKYFSNHRRQIEKWKLEIPFP